MSRSLTLIIILLFMFLSLSPASAESRRGEMRGVWIRGGSSVGWSTAMKSLKENGFNAVFRTFNVGNMGDYPLREDDLTEITKAAKENGIELHVGQANWTLARTPEDLRAQLDAAGRLQRNSRGERGADDPSIGCDWLCPSNPDNRKLVKDGMIELVRKYDVAGVILDDMRFPNSNYCFCNGCRQRFEQKHGAKVQAWPADIMEGGPLAAEWQQWRQGLMTSFTHEISDAAHALKPDICVSLAAWPNIEDGRDIYGQDWVTLAKDGTLDFVLPVDYTYDKQSLASTVERQVTAVRGAIPLYPCIAVYRMKSAGDLIDQIEAARSAGADGFIVLSSAYGTDEFEKWLPDLRATVTTEDPSPMPHGGPPARFTFSGDATRSPASGRNVTAGAKLDIEMAIGWEPPAATDKTAEGAADAGAMLEHVLNPGYAGVTYGERPTPTAPSNAERISGRIIVETPDGTVLCPLGAFNTEYRFDRKTSFTAPQGPFRLAIYGSVKSPNGKREFVVRAPLMVGVSAEHAP